MTVTEAARGHEPALAVRGLHAAYGTRRVLNDVSFDVRAGEIFVIMGASGSGKTTLLRHLLGLSTPLNGEIDLLGEALHPAPREQVFALRRRIGVAFQHGALINSMSVVENIELPLHQHTRLDRATIRIMSRMKLEMMNLAEAEHYMPAELSGGMLKRAGLARACIMDPKLLFFDEPSAGLDPVSADELDSLILRLRDALNMTIVVVTHALESVVRIADRVLVIGDGGVRALGTLEELRALDDAYVAGLLGRRGARRDDDGEALIERLTADIDD
ncbi:MAG: ATP-binding cassette domain-containing protein [Sinobacteraceae bacterium]|nr:ATP-binding cassette domain-containing protein [Gammaproteobacteria bacterium]MCP5467589.1 ATP-binding cassette domain-containing protein [Nevskiaceae bacterium]